MSEWAVFARWRRQIARLLYVSICFGSAVLTLLNATLLIGAKVNNSLIIRKMNAPCLHGKRKQKNI